MVQCLCAAFSLDVRLGDYINTGGGDLKKRTVFIAGGVIFAVFIGFVAYAAVDYAIGNNRIGYDNKDRVEYPLKNVVLKDDSEYVLVKVQNGQYEVVADTKAIKKNKSAFRITNSDAMYEDNFFCLLPIDGTIMLFKDGRIIDDTGFDSTLTKKIEYGTLNFQPVNYLQYWLLIGYEIVEQDKNYTIIYGNMKESETVARLYYYFVHGDDTQSPETVYLINNGRTMEELPKLRKLTEDVLEFTTSYPVFPDYVEVETVHGYFRLSDCELRRGYSDVKAIKGNLIVYAQLKPKGPCIVIQDIFDETVYYKEIAGDFSEQAGRRFLLSAEFTADNKLKATYIGKDGQTRTEAFSLE